MSAWSYRGTRRAACTTLAVLAMLAPGAAAAATARTDTPAQWRTYDLLIDLQDLPRSYSCTQLWYKFRDLLLHIGARHYMLIEPERCALPGGAPAR